MKILKLLLGSSTLSAKTCSLSITSLHSRGTYMTVTACTALAFNGSAAKGCDYQWLVRSEQCSETVVAAQRIHLKTL